MQRSVKFQRVLLIHLGGINNGERAYQFENFINTRFVLRVLNQLHYDQ